MNFIKNDLVRVATAINEISIANPDKNSERIINIIDKAIEKKVDILVLPPLCTTSCSCGELFNQKKLISSSEEALKKIVKKTENKEMLIILSSIVKIDNSVSHYLLAIQEGQIIDRCPLKDSKETLYNLNKYLDHFYSSDNLMFLKSNNLTISVSYSSSIKNTTTTKDHINIQLLTEANIAGRTEPIEHTFKVMSSKRNNCQIVISPHRSESTAEFVSLSKALICEDGKILSSSEDLSIVDIDYGSLKSKTNKNIEYTEFKRSNKDKKLSKQYDRYPLVPKERDFQTIIDIQSEALAQRLNKTNIKSIVLGISGGLDSTWALIASTHAFKNLGLPLKNITAISMPGPGSTTRTKSQAEELCKALDVNFKNISISDSIKQHLKDINHPENDFSTAYENSQARERTQILMDIANMNGALVVGTGDLSEIALGWATYNGDQMSMYNINAGLPKTLIKALVKWYGSNNQNLEDVLSKILNTPISPELIPGKNDKIIQKTEEIIGNYDVNDFFLHKVAVCRYTPRKILEISKIVFEEESEENLKTMLNNFYRRFITQQFKRNASPDGPKVIDISLSKLAFQIPSDADFEIFTKDLKK